MLELKILNYNDISLLITKKCVECEIIKPINKFYIRKLSKDGYRTECIDCSRERSRRSRRKYRDKRLVYCKKWGQDRKYKVITHYGGKCVCCKENCMDFLVLDHKYGGGNKHREKIGHGRGAVAAYIHG